MVALLEAPEEPKKGLFRIEEPVFNDEKQLVYGGMFAPQRAWWQLPNFIRLFVGGYGSGKTIQLCKRHISLALQNAPVPTAIVSPTYPMARQTVISTLIDLLEAQKGVQRFYGNFLDYKVRRTPPFEFTITHVKRHKDPVTKLVTGETTRVGKIIVYSGEDPNKLKGPNLSSAGIDEPFVQEQAVFEQMVFRVRHRLATKLEVNLTGTPEQLNWGYELAEGELRKKFDVGIIQASTTSNRALAKSYEERLFSAFDAKGQQAYIHGMFVNMAAGLVYYGFDRSENVVTLPRPLDVQLGCGMDFNVNPMSASIFWVREGKHPHIHFFEEIELANSDTQDMCKVLREKYWHEGLREIYPDSNAGRSTASPGGKTDYDYIEEAGFNLNKHMTGNPHRRDRYNATNAMLKPYGKHVRMTISPNCPKLLKYMMSYSHELMNRPAQKAMSHLLDATTYPVAYLFPSSRESLKHFRLMGAHGA
jgi:hypothetical protein